MNKLIRKKIDPSLYFKDIVIPDDWDSLEDFVDWYLESKMPLMIPFNAMSILSDDASAICIFRKGHYQVEFYIVFPEMWIRRHSHPRMEVIILDLGGGTLAPKDEHNVSKFWGNIYNKISENEYHAGSQSVQISTGTAQLAFQRWQNPDEITSAAIQWKGDLQGPIQANLIKEHKKDAYVTDNYADITKKII
jgi:hypothetical protein